MPRMHIAISAATKLALFRERQLDLTESHYDALCDTLIDLLEETRNEAYRLKPDVREDPEPERQAP